ncbi:hypothetical protein K1719_023494 [Acacia pycnantha]|nr:hypothetical protein K1719_023494 [Acacia pycnantha]
MSLQGLTTSFNSISSMASVETPCSVFFRSSAYIHSTPHTSSSTTPSQIQLRFSFSKSLLFFTDYNSFSYLSSAFFPFSNCSSYFFNSSSTFILSNLSISNFSPSIPISDLVSIPCQPIPPPRDQNPLYDMQSPNRKPLVAFISVLAILFLTLSVGVTLGALIHNSNSGPRSTPSTANTSVIASIKTVCNVTRFPSSCYSSISSLTSSLQNPNDPESILKLSPRISAAMTDLEMCLDGLEETEPAALGEMKGKMQRSREYTSNRKI